MNSELITFIAIIGLLLSWVTIPMIPAILIYKLFPDTHVTAEGPFANLTIKATGAFAGYLIVFAATFFVAEKGISIVASFQKPYWTISGSIVLDHKEHQFDSQILKQLVVTTHPPPFEVLDDRIKLQVPEGRDIPSIVLDIPNFGRALVHLSDKDTSIEKDEFKKEIRIEEAIMIKQNAESWKYSVKKTSTNVLKSQVWNQ
jgi:hypothetical protein